MTNTPEIYLHDYEKKLVQIFHQHSLYGITGLKSLGQSRNHLISKLPIKMLAKAGPNGNPIATPSTYLQQFLLHIKINHLVLILSKL